MAVDAKGCRAICREEENIYVVVVVFLIVCDVSGFACCVLFFLFSCHDTENVESGNYSIVN